MAVKAILIAKKPLKREAQVDIHMARQYLLVPGTFLDHRNPCPNEQRNEDDFGE